MTEIEKEKWDWVLELYRAWKPQIKRGYEVLKYVSGRKIYYDTFYIKILLRFIFLIFFNLMKDLLLR